MAEPQTQTPAETPPVVLVVEDEILIRLAVAEFLRECGWRVLEAVSAEEAIAVLQSGDVAVDVVFSDIRMPGPEDGFRLARWVRQNCPGTRVLLTSGAVPSVAAKAGDLCEDGPDHNGTILAKPYTSRDVIGRIEAMLGRVARSGS